MGCLLLKLTRRLQGRRDFDVRMPPPGIDRACAPAYNEESLITPEPTSNEQDFRTQADPDSRRGPMPANADETLAHDALSRRISSLLLRPMVLTPPLRLVPPFGWTQHIPFAFWIVDALRPSCIVELGTHSGNSYSAFAQAVAMLQLPAACYAVDTWKGDPQTGLYGEEVFEEWRDFHDRHFGGFSTLVRQRFDDAVSAFPDSSIDLLHIDGCHTYEAVGHDFETWLPKLSARSVVLLHDINVRQSGFGVWRLWEELQQRFPSAFTFVHGHGLGVLGVGRELTPDVHALLTDARTDRTCVARTRQFFATLGEAVQRRVSDNERTPADRVALHAEIRRLESEAAGESARATLLQRDLENLHRLVRDTRTSETLARHREKLAAHKAADAERAIARAAGELKALRSTRECVSMAVVALGAVRERSLWRRSSRIRRGLMRLGILRSGDETSDPRVSALIRPRGVPASLERDAEIIAQCGLFDEPFYLARCPDAILSGTPAIEHYLLKGATAGYSPSVLFDSSYYRLRNPDVVATGTNPLLHYLTRGPQDHRDPHPLFSTSFYLSENPAVARSGVNPLVDFLRHGGAGGRSPHPLFDAAAYLARYRDVAASRRNPLVHFLEYGAAERRNPHALFDTAFYLDTYPDVIVDFVNPLVHYVTVGWREGRDPSPTFSTRDYLSAHPELKNGDECPLVHYVRQKMAEPSNADPPQPIS
jgi:methyltransferase family protein